MGRHKVPYVSLQHCTYRQQVAVYFCLKSSQWDSSLVQWFPQRILLKDIVDAAGALAAEGADDGVALGGIGGLAEVGDSAGDARGDG